MLPITMLAAEHPALARWMAVIAPFSMFPLLKKDGLTMAYCVVTACCATVIGSLQRLPEDSSHAEQAASSTAAFASLGMMAGMHAVAAVATPPAKYPYIFDAAMVSWAFLHYAGIFLFTNAEHWRTGVKHKTQ